MKPGEREFWRMLAELIRRDGGASAWKKVSREPKITNILFEETRRLDGR